MSLINDALKEASRASNRLQPSAAAGAPSIPMRPVEERAGGRQNRVILPIALVIVLALAAWCFREWWSASQKQMLTEMVQNITSGKLSSAKNPPAATAVQAVKAGPASSSDHVAATPVKSASTKVEATAAQPATATTVAAAPAVAAQPKTPPRPFPTLKLQGVSYRKTGGSSALVNGRIVGEGDEVEGVTIARIESQSVTLEFSGQQKVLRLR